MQISFCASALTAQNCSKLCILDAQSGTFACGVCPEVGGRVIFRVIVQQGRYVHRLTCLHVTFHLFNFVITSL